MVDILKAKTDADGFKLHLVADTKEQFLAGMILAFNGCRASHFAVSPHWGMIFLEGLHDWEKGLKEHRHYLSNRYVDVPELREGPGFHQIRYKLDQPHFAETYKFEWLHGKWGAMKCAEKAWAWLKNDAEYLEPGYISEDDERDERITNPHNYEHDSDMSNWEGYEINTRGPTHSNVICYIRPRFVHTGK